MPGKYASRKRNFKRKRSPFRSRTYINRIADAAPQNQMSRFLSSFNPFPAIHYATLRYCTKITLTNTVAAISPTHFFRANSIHDPDYTGLTFGGQPYGHDTYANIYNHYQVLGSTITVQCQCPNNRRYNGFGILLQDNNNIIEDEARQLCAMKGATYVIGNQGNIVTLKRSFTQKYMQDKSTQCARFGSDVDDPMYFVVYSMDDEGNDEEVGCLITINYKVKMWELKDLSAT